MLGPIDVGSNSGSPLTRWVTELSEPWILSLWNGWNYTTCLAAFVGALSEIVRCDSWYSVWDTLGKNISISCFIKPKPDEPHLSPYSHKGISDSSSPSVGSLTFSRTLGSNARRCSSDPRFLTLATLFRGTLLDGVIITEEAKARELVLWLGDPRW